MGVPSGLNWNVPFQGKPGFPGLPGPNGNDGPEGKDGRPGLDGFPGPQVREDKVYFFNRRVPERDTPDIPCRVPPRLITTAVGSFTAGFWKQVFPLITSTDASVTVPLLLNLPRCQFRIDPAE